MEWTGCGIRQAGHARRWALRLGELIAVESITWGPAPEQARALEGALERVLETIARCAHAPQVLADNERPCAYQVLGELLMVCGARFNAQQREHIVQGCLQEPVLEHEHGLRAWFQDGLPWHIGERIVHVRLHSERLLGYDVCAGRPAPPAPASAGVVDPVQLAALWLPIERLYAGRA